jgi:hypothetical protein
MASALPRPQPLLAGPTAGIECITGCEVIDELLRIT